MIIPSLLWTDFYKYTMGQVVLHQCSGAWTKFKLQCRNGTGLPFTKLIDNQAFIEDINKEIDALCTLRLTPDELTHLRTVPYFKPEYLEFLRLLQLNRAYIDVTTENGRLCIKIEGPWISTIWFEIPVLLIVSTLYNKYRPDKSGMSFNIEQEGKKRLKQKTEWLSTCLHWDAPFLYADFGTRRAWSPEWHEYVVRTLVRRHDKWFMGTSNVYLAMKFGLKMIGTMAHELFQGFQQLDFKLVDAQKAALQAWANEYRGELGIALSDTYGFDAFCRDFDRYFALLFDGCRHDSGDPAQWCDKLLTHYKDLRVDARTKTAVFSDGLTFPIALNLYNKFSTQINTSFGIGTYLTNDLGIEAMQFVIKMVECNHRPVAKISDSPGKCMCESGSYARYLEEVYNIKRL